jgi:predicted DNA binding CopG/RHH family protein
MSDTKSKGGRPRERAESVKKAPISIRTVPELREAIERRSAANGLSFTQQVERLLRLGLERDEAA